jgi:hypothetical protein
MNKIVDTEVARLKMDDGVVMQLGSKMYSQSVWWVVLRELIQNGLDAGATVISISTNWNDELIVQDNGSGMSKQDLLGIFLTVGGSDKIRNKNTVGGFGIAKLAIFSCDNFEVVSNTWKLTKDILLNHQPLERTDQLGQNGTWVKIKKHNLMSSFDTKSEINWYLRSINRSDVTILFQNVEVIPFKPEAFEVSNYGRTPAVAESYYSNSTLIIVRANGLPVFKSSIFNGNKAITFFYDVYTELDPYDPLYPFTITRDDFGSDLAEKEKYMNFHRALDNHFRKMAEMEQIAKVNLTYDPIHDIWLSHGAVSNPENISQLGAFKKMVLLLASLKEVSTDSFAFGLIGSAREKGAYAQSEEKNKDIFFISQRIVSQAELVAIALHEFSHLEAPQHYEGFAVEMTQNAERLFALIIAKESMEKLEWQ